MKDNIKHIECQLIGKILIDNSVLFNNQELFNQYEFQGVNKYIIEQLAKGQRSTIKIADEITGHFNSKNEAIMYLTHCRSIVNFEDSTDVQLLFLIENRNNKLLIKGLQELLIYANSGATVDDCRERANIIFSNIDNIHKQAISPFLANLSALRDMINTNRHTTGLKLFKTGLNGYDDFNGGIIFSDLEIIAAKSSMGKTSFALGRVKSIAKQGCPCAIFNYEMSATQLTARLISPIIPTSSKKLLTANLSDNELIELDNAIASAQDLPIYIADTTSSSLQHCLSQMRLLHYNYGVNYFVIDYLQRMHISGFRGLREQEVGEMSKKLKDIAKELDVKVDLLSQLSRDKNREGKEPILSDLRDSGQIEESADIVTFIHRPEFYLKELCEEEWRGKAKIIQAKGRNSGINEFICKFNAELTEFSNDEYELKPIYSIKPNRNFSEPEF